MPSGVALTSPASQDERNALPSQQKSSNAYKRQSVPAGNDYAELLKSLEPGDRTNLRSFSYNDNSKRRSQYFEEQFSYKDGAMPHSKEKVQRNSPIMVDLRTNVIIKDEFTLVTDLTLHLAQRYTRPEACIMIKVDHSACLALGGNFDPCYFLAINSVPSTVGPTTNKRNAAIIQGFLADILSVPPERGIITFRAVKEENLAMNGTTILGEMERQDKFSGVKDPISVKAAIQDATRRSMTFPKSNPKLNGDYQSNGNLAVGSTSSPSITPPPPPLSAMRDHAGSADKDGRPSTAHGGFDGLRMNGVSTEQLVGPNARLPNGRPKTFSGSTPTSIQDSMKQEPLPHVFRQTTNQSHRASMQRATPASKRASTTTSVPQSATKHQPNGSFAPRPILVPRTNSTASTPASANKPKTATPSNPENRTKNTYLDGTSSLTKKNATPTLKSDEQYDDDDDATLTASSKGRAANTAAKRRSTITATPQLPSSRRGDRSVPSGVLKPPPIPDDTKSMNSKLGKRKSFLRMFKRSSVPAWYDQ